jgi:hypothetical protein
MQRHELEPLSLVAGIIFVMVGGGYAIDHSGAVHLHWIALLPAGLIVVGVAILAVIARGLRTSTPAEPPSDV